MNDVENISRLKSILSDTDALVNAAHQVWALDTSVGDEHLENMAGWADLQHLMLAGTNVTNRSLDAIATFKSLLCLDIGGTAITSSGIASASIPLSVRDFSLFDIPLGDDAVSAIAALPKLRSLNCNGCNLSYSGLLRVLRLPTLHSIEALGTEMPDSHAEEFSRARPKFLLRLDSGVWRAGNVRRPPGKRA